MIESDSLVGTKWVNALNGTGCATVVLPEPLDPPPPPPLEEPLVEVLDDPVELEREVPLAEVVALEEVLVDVLAVVSALALLLAELDSGELEFTVAVDGVDVALLGDSAEVELAVEDTPLVAEDVSRDALAPLDPEPAPADDPCVLDPVAATVPVVVACT